MFGKFSTLLTALAASLLAVPAFAQASPSTDRQANENGQNAQSRQDDRSQSSGENSTGQQPIFEASRIQDANTASSRDNREAAGSLLDRSRGLAAPATPNEFEKYVERAIGRPLKRYGSDLLLPESRDFARAADATIPPDYRINIGDAISISMTGSVEGSVERTVDPRGKIFLPSVGEIQLAGVRYGDLKEVLIRAIGTQYRNFRVGVRTTELRGLRVFVTGFPNNPGAFTVSSLSTAFNAILQAGGPAAGGSFRTIRLVRSGHEVADIDLYSILMNGDRSRDAVLENEDVLFVLPTLPQFAVWGSVQREAIYELRPGETLADALRFAGGANELADSTRAIIYRSQLDSNAGPQIVEQAAFATTKINPGDIIQILAEGNLIRPLDRQSVLVRLEGEVQKPGNYLVAPNTPLEKVVEMAGGLTSRAYPFGAEFKRQSVLMQQRRSFKDALDLFELSLATAPLKADGSIDQGRQQAQLAAAQAALEKLRKAEPDGRLVLEIGPAARILPPTLTLENGDSVFVPVQPTSIGVFGAVYRPASFQIGAQGPKRIKDYFAMAGGSMRAGDPASAFVVRANGEVLTRKRGAFDAVALPGDVLFVPVKTTSRDLLAKIAQISTVLFQFGLSAATIAAIK